MDEESEKTGDEVVDLPQLEDEEKDEKRLLVESRVAGTAETQMVVEDIQRLLKDLEERAMRDSIFGDYRRNIVDYTWEEMLEMLDKERIESLRPQEKLWRADPFDSIKDLMKPEFNINIPNRTEVDWFKFEDDDCSTESDEPFVPRPRIFPFRMRHDNLNDYSKVYWHAREHIRNLRIGNDLAIMTTLTVMTDLPFDNEETGYGIVDCGGLETLMNLATINYITIQLGSLKILKKMADHYIIQRIMLNQGVHLVCFKLLPHYEYDVVNLSSDILLKLSELKCFRPIVRNTVGLEMMLEVAELPDKYYALPENTFPDNPDVEEKIYYAAKNCLQTLRNTHRSKLVRRALYKLGFVRLLRKLIYSSNKFLKSIGQQMLCEASSCILYQQIFVLEGFTKYVLDSYRAEQPDGEVGIMMLKAIYNCLNNEVCKNFLLDNGLVKYQMNQLTSLPPKKQMKYTLACVVQFLRYKKYRLYLNKCDIIPKLLQLFKHSDGKVREYSGRIVAELSRYWSNHDTLVGEQHLGLTWLFDMCDHLLDYDLLAHVYKIVMELSYIPTIYWWVADKLEVIQLLWAAITNPNPRCIEYGCSALVPYIGPIPGSEDIVRRIPGGIFDLLSLTHHEDEGAIAGAVTLLGRIVNDDENLEILASLGFIERLFQLAKTAKHPRLKYAIGLAFGSCGHDRKKSFELGQRGAVNILVEWLLNDDDTYEQLGVVTGLWKLSYELINCMAMIKFKIVERLTEIMACENECLHNSVAGLVSNMRQLARDAEYQKYVDSSLPPDDVLGTIEEVDLVLPYQYPDVEEPTIHMN